VVFADGTDADVVAFAQDDLEAAVQVFHVRGGRVRGERGWTIDKAATVDGTSGVPELVEQFITQFYGSSEEVEGAEGGGMDGAGIPREILVPELPANADVAMRPARQPGVAAGTTARRQTSVDGNGGPQCRAGIRPAQAASRV
jgi:excinuclease ABC subunit C